MAWAVTTHISRSSPYLKIYCPSRTSERVVTCNQTKFSGQLGLERGVRCNPRVTFDGKVRNLGPCVLKFESPLPENHRANILSTADSPLHHCNLGGGSASISCTSVYRGSKRGRRVVRRPRRAKLDCPTTGDRGPALTLVRLELRALAEPQPWVPLS